MIAALMVLLLGLVVSAAVPAGALPLVNRVRPSTVVPLLAVGSVISAASVGVMLSLLAMAVVGRVPAVAALGGWSIATLAVAVPVPLAVGVPAAALAAFLLARTLWRAAHILLLLGRSDRLSRRLRGGGGPIVVIDDLSADAFTLAGLKGAVVISRDLLDALGPAERHMLTGHEMSHLRWRHHLYVHAVSRWPPTRCCPRPPMRCDSASNVGPTRTQPGSSAIAVSPRRLWPEPRWSARRCAARRAVTLARPCQCWPWWARTSPIGPEPCSLPLPAAPPRPRSWPPC